MELPKRLQCDLINIINMVHIQTYASVLSTDDVPKARRKNDVQCFIPVSSYLLSSDGNINLVYIIHIYNALENSQENATGGVLEKIINKNPDPAKLELYSLQLY